MCQRDTCSGSLPAPPFARKGLRLSRDTDEDLMLMMMSFEIIRMILAFYGPFIEPIHYSTCQLNNNNNNNIDS